MRIADCASLQTGLDLEAQRTRCGRLVCLPLPLAVVHAPMRNCMRDRGVCCKPTEVRL